ncbi:MAG: class B sortase [Firmicutes bacterium]|nr:class B sortase [[Eubacterium] siraeum]MCM1488103.1 class B sortase [Bacillota bacterium]
MTNYTARPPLIMAKGKQKNAFMRGLVSVVPVKGDSGAEIIRKIVFIVAVIAFIITGGTLISDIYSQAKEKYVVNKQIEEIKAGSSGGNLNLAPEVIQQIKQEKPYIREDLMQLYDVNNDFVGWFNLGGDANVINYPVVQTDNNDYYLVTNFFGEPAKTGTIYVDCRSAFNSDGTSPNFMVLYGHNTSSSEAFSKLTRYYYEKDNPDESANKLLSFYQKYPTIKFETLKEDSTYKVFACGLYNTEEQYGEVYNYIRRGAAFTDKDDFNSYVLDIMDRSVLFTDVDLTYGDEIICMSTCYFPFGMSYENVRCAIFARKVREGESPEVDVSKAVRNEYWIGWQQAVDRKICSPYAARKWDTSKLLSYEG